MRFLHAAVVRDCIFLASSKQLFACGVNLSSAHHMHGQRSRSGCMCIEPAPRRVPANVFSKCACSCSSGNRRTTPLLGRASITSASTPFRLIYPTRRRPRPPLPLLAMLCPSTTSRPSTCIHAAAHPSASPTKLPLPR
jgi:hypothetical protein